MFTNIIKQINKLIVSSRKTQLFNGVSLVMAEVATARNVQAPNSCIYCTTIPPVILQDPTRPRKYQESIFIANQFIAEPLNCPFNPIQVLCPINSLNSVSSSLLLRSSHPPLPSSHIKPLKRPYPCLVNVPLFHRHKEPRKRSVYYRMFNNLRKWETVNNDRTGFNFTIMNYNVLAQDLVLDHPYLYSNHDPSCLPWTKRWNNLLAEIRLFNPDILCLQEVQSSHLQEYFSTLENFGYKGLYKKRTGARTDGCAIYYKFNKIQLIEYTTLEYNQPNVPLLDRDNVALIAKFAPKEHLQKEFIVSTTHLLYNPRRNDVRLAQTQLLLAEIDRIAFKPENDDEYLPVILTGDFNSQPYSDVYNLIRNREINLENVKKFSSPDNKKRLVPPILGITNQCQHVSLIKQRKEKRHISRSEEVSLIKIRHPDKTDNNDSNSSTSELDLDLFSSGILSHKFPFESVYQHFVDNDIEGTTYQDEWITVDFIFYSFNKGKRGFKLLERFELPLRTQLEEKYIRIPNENLGSDHFSLVAKFKLEYF